MLFRRLIRLTTPAPAALVLLAAALCLPAGPLRAQAPARVDTLEDGTRTFHYDQVDEQMTPEEKVSLLNEKVRKNPADGRAWNDLGVLLAGQENYPAARDAFIHAVQCDKKNGDYHRNLGLVFSRLDMPEMAVAELGEYRKFDQVGGLDYWRLIGSAQRKAGQLDEARQTYRDGIADLKPPVAETFRLVLALHELETEGGRRTGRSRPAGRSTHRRPGHSWTGWPRRRTPRRRTAGRKSPPSCTTGCRC